MLWRIKLWGLGWLLVPACSGPSPQSQNSNQAWVDLGRQLFFSELLDENGTQSCASCHVPDHGFSNALAHHPLANPKLPSRNAPSLLDVGEKASLHWDGGVPDLESQVLVPLHPQGDFAAKPQEAIKRLKANDHMRRTFKQVSGSEPSLQNLCKALACFQRSLKSPATRWDSLAAHPNRISTQEKNDWRLFNALSCGSCHRPPAFRDGGFYATGLMDLTQDEGRMRITGDSLDRFAFGTPSLRGLNRTAPYFHDGRENDLPKALQMHALGLWGKTLSSDSLAALLRVLSSLHHP